VFSKQKKPSARRRVLRAKPTLLRLRKKLAIRPKAVVRRKAAVRRPLPLLRLVPRRVPLPRVRGTK
jgi:hypothetical protein